ncbi:MAG: hypothetical protein HY363_05590 [Candidatus Aenigmarchaeota archaeon]|nr:hypothetical protein [Candidatus Aenigmarchaeota archaeon]
MKKTRKTEETTPLFSNNTKAFLGVFSVVLVVAALFLSEQPEAYVVGQIPFARDISPPIQQAGNTFVIKNIDLGDTIGKDAPTLTVHQLRDLSSATIQTNAGKTELNQFLILQRPGVFTGGEFIFGRDNEGRLGSFLRFKEDEPMFEYVMTFSPGLKSMLQNGRLTDLIETTLPLLGRRYTIVDAQYNENTKNILLRMMGNAGVIDFEDHIGDLKFDHGVKVNKQFVNADVRITALLVNNLLTISEIRYQPKAQGYLGDVYIPPSNGLRTRITHPGLLLSTSFDIIHSSKKTQAAAYGGEYVTFDGKNGDYKMTFSNDLGQQYTVQLVTTNPNFKYGDDDEDLVFKEGSNNADFNIDRNDVFILTNKEDINGVTNVLRYNRVLYDAGEIIFDDLAGGSTTTAFDTATGKGTLVSSGNAYTFFVSSGGEHPIVVDQNGDGAIDGDEARIVLRTGSMIDLGASNVIAGTQIQLSITTPRRLFDEKQGDETVNFVITEKSEGPDIEFPNPGALTIKRDKGGIDRGLSIFGIYMVRDPNRIPSQVVFQFPGAGTVRTPQKEGSAVLTLEREKFVKKR